jgi:ComF family protein
MLKAVSDSLFALLYPQPCQNCNNISENFAGGVTCEDCWAKTRIFSGNETLCHKCGAFLSENKSPFETFCHRCDDHFYDRALAAGIYEHGLAASVIHLKTTPQLSRKARGLFLSAFDNSPFDDVTRIIPVPLSRKRLLERGFNQAVILARILAKDSRLPLDEEMLLRKVHTPIHRAAMDKKARDLTVRNAFETASPNNVKDENILLVDDVFTSGATASYCAKVLKKNGAGKVYVLTLARAV